MERKGGPGAAALCLARDPARDPAAVKACVVDNASRGALRDLPGNTPNLLVYAGAEAEAEAGGE